ncbi:hypothetical protein D3C71_1689470 [compost metagenome]
MKCGHGTHARQPPSSGSVRHCTARLPLIAKGRCRAAETFSLSSGLTRFQSKVAITTTRIASRVNRLARVQTRILAGRVIA